MSAPYAVDPNQPPQAYPPQAGYAQPGYPQPGYPPQQQQVIYVQQPLVQ